MDADTARSKSREKGHERIVWQTNQGEPAFVGLGGARGADVGSDARPADRRDLVVVAIVVTVAAAFAARKGSATPPRPRPAAIHAAALPAAVIEAVSLKSGDVVESAASISATQPGKSRRRPSRRRRRRPVKRRVRPTRAKAEADSKRLAVESAQALEESREPDRELELLRKQADQQARQAEAARGESARADAVAVTALPPEKASERRPPSVAEQKTAQAVAEAPRVSSPPEPAPSLNHPRHPRLARPRRGKRPSFQPAAAIRHAAFIQWAQRDPCRN